MLPEVFPAPSTKVNDWMPSSPGAVWVYVSPEVSSVRRHVSCVRYRYVFLLDPMNAKRGLENICSSPGLVPSPEHIQKEQGKEGAMVHDDEVSDRLLMYLSPAHVPPLEAYGLDDALVHRKPRLASILARGPTEHNPSFVFQFLRLGIGKQGAVDISPLLCETVADPVLKYFCRKDSDRFRSWLGDGERHLTSLTAATGAKKAMLCLSNGIYPVDAVDYVGNGAVFYTYGIGPVVACPDRSVLTNDGSPSLGKNQPRPQNARLIGVSNEDRVERLVFYYIPGMSGHDRDEPVYDHSLLFHDKQGTLCLREKLLNDEGLAHSWH